MNNYMLDTTFFNHILDAGFSLSSLPSLGQTIVTHIQLDEIRDTKNADRRGELLHIFSNVKSRKVATEKFVLGFSSLGNAKLSNDVALYESLLKNLNDKNRNKLNNIKDILIAETAIKNKYTLVTDDSDLTEVVQNAGGDVIPTSKYLSLRDG